jgi:hypothetical protein
MAKPLFTGPEVMAWDASQTDVYGSEEGRQAGAQVLEMIGEALRRRPEESRVRAVGECVRRFPHETLRHPDVCAYFEHLSGRRDAAALTRILADRPRRGRPARQVEEEFTEAAVLEGIVAREGCSVRRAAEIAREEFPRVFGHQGVRTIENNFSMKRDAYRLARQPRWVAGSKLSGAAWVSPEQRRRKR